ncbi:WD40 repeat-like protein [Gonapodya prolifera JEL478]|uniref:WD40 repeat-like protein n=1 Tax=Gonapodya prolifera (strain JEL478) TaxID=1344416 RepID=A0A139AVQ2_GONPJ|nr:WD40 repeat-like protein [Gonapodya prolifera JEL478]|eukprot:KXS20810.1 WD40 repeat-like protein [Gonapodya prolifera JEL478]
MHLVFLYAGIRSIHAESRGFTYKLGVKFKPHEMTLTNCCLNKAGDRYVNASYDRSVRLYSTSTLLSTPSQSTSPPPPLLTLNQHESLVYHLTYNLPFSDKLLTCSLDRTARLWDGATGKSLYALVGHQGEVVAGCFDAKSTKIATGGMDGAALVWDVRTGLQVARLDAHEDGVPVVEFEPSFAERETTRDKNGSIITAGMDGHVRVWDLRNPAEEVWDWGLDDEASVTGASWVGESRTVVAGGTDGTVRLWDAVSGAEIGMSRDCSGDVLSVVASIDGAYIAAAGSDGVARIYDGKTLRLLHTLQGTNNEICRVTFSPSGEMLLTSGNEGTIRLWDVAGGHCLQTLDDHSGSVFAAHFSYDSTKVITAARDDTVIVYEAV